MPINELSAEAEALPVSYDMCHVPIKMFLQLLLVKSQGFYPATAHHEYLPFRETTREIAEFAAAHDPSEVIVHVQPPDGRMFTQWRVYSAAWWREDNRRRAIVCEADEMMRQRILARDEKIAELYTAIYMKRYGRQSLIKEQRMAEVSEAANLVMYRNIPVCLMVYEVDISELSPDVLAPKYSWTLNVCDVFRKLWDTDIK